VDVVGDDRFTVWEAAGEYGPNSCAKTTAKCLTNYGNDAVLDADSQFEWLVEGVSLRPELEGMGIIYAKVQRESDQSDHTFNHPIFLDAETNNMILPGKNEGDSNESAQGSSSDDSSGDDAETTSTETEAGDGPLAEFYDTCEELSINTEPAVLGLLEDMVEDDDNDLTEAMVDRDEIVADLAE